MKLNNHWGKHKKLGILYLLDLKTKFVEFDLRTNPMKLFNNISKQLYDSDGNSQFVYSVVNGVLLRNGNDSTKIVDTTQLCEFSIVLDEQYILKMNRFYACIYDVNKSSNYALYALIGGSVSYPTGFCGKTHDKNTGRFIMHGDLCNL